MEAARDQSPGERNCCRDLLDGQYRYDASRAQEIGWRRRHGAAAALLWGAGKPVGTATRGTIAPG
jgi:hypothetical protein